MNIVVFSCANTGNFGDDIILQGIKKKLSREYPDHGGIIRQILRINAETVKLINRQDFLIIGGGEILSNSDMLKQIVKYDIKIPYMFLSVGIGNKEDINPYLKKIHPTVWYARTQKDLEILNECGVKNAMVHKDLLFECCVKRKPNGRIGLNIKNQKKSPAFVESMAHILDMMIAAGIEIDLLALNCKPQQQIDYCGEKIMISDCNDLDLMEKIQSMMKKNINIVAYNGKDPLRFLDILSDYDGIVGERLHSIMAAFHSKIDFRVVPYHPKIDKFLDMHGLNDKKIDGTPTDIGMAIKELWLKRLKRPREGIYEHNA